MKSVQEYIKVLEDIESSATEQGGNVKGPFTAGQLAQIFSKLPPDAKVEMTMNEEYQDEVGSISWGRDYVLIDDH
jgi:hypothetical protein